MVLSSWQSHCESSSGSFDECRTAPNDRRPKTKPDDLGCKSACTGCQNLHPPSPFIIITQPENWYSFYRPIKGRRLSRPIWLVTISHFNYDNDCTSSRHLQMYIHTNQTVFKSHNFYSLLTGRCTESCRVRNRTEQFYGVAINLVYNRPWVGVQATKQVIGRCAPSPVAR